MRINHNLASLNTYRQLTANATEGSKSMEKLSSGLRINRAGDDAAGLAISEKMRGQIRGLDQAARNAQDGISMIQTAEGALNETHSILQRMRELAVQSSSGTNTDADRKAIQDEISQLKGEIDRIGNTTEFNTQKLLNGNLKSAGNAVVGQDMTLGSTIAKLTNAKVTGSETLNVMLSGIADTDFVKETINIDGTNIDVNWQNLSSDEKNILKTVTTDPTSREKAKDLIINKINEAIDQSGKNLSHVTGYVDSTGKLIIESGSQGVDSKIVTGSSGILSKAISSTAQTSGVGAATYNGATITAGTAFDFKIGNIALQGTTTGITINTTATMASAAAALQSNINGVISNYNTLQGKTAGQEGFIQDVKVNATKDGRLEIISESGPVTFSDIPGNEVIKNLGLSSAQTEASGNGGMTFQIGANKGQTINFGINDMRTAALGLSSVDVSTQAGASSAITSIDKAITSVSSERAKLGAVQNRLEHTINNLGTSSENLTAAESRIRDVDMAKEMMQFSKNNILSQAAQAMLAQANQQPQGVLQLLR